MSTLSSLRTLDLQSNPLTSIDELNNLKLNVLDAQNCKIEYLPTNLPYLYNLNMSSNNLEDLFGIGTLGRVSSRDKNFDFSHNRIEIVPPEISLIISWIQTFSVKNNHLSHLPKEFFGLYDGDKTQIDLSQNWFSDDELNLIKTTMQTKLPHVQVVY
ncbi:hypothetical protein I4U23_004194 [Adineta vaga]|nr:hypothetical protein I4U23_004194 [Adineta vaga]